MLWLGLGIKNWVQVRAGSKSSAFKVIDSFYQCWHVFLTVALCKNSQVIMPNTLSMMLETYTKKVVMVYPKLVQPTDWHL